MVFVPAKDGEAELLVNFRRMSNSPEIGKIRLLNATGARLLHYGGNALFQV